MPRKMFQFREIVCHHHIVCGISLDFANICSHRALGEETQYIFVSNSIHIFLHFHINKNFSSATFQFTVDVKKMKVKLRDFVDVCIRSFSITQQQARTHNDTENKNIY